MREPTKTLVPKLRFLEFKDAREWEEKRLEDVCTKISQGGTPDTTNLDYWNGDVEWLTPAEMGKLETRFITTTNRKISRAGLKNCSSDLLPIDSVILSTRAPIGHLLINKSEMAINQGCKGLMSLPSTDHNYLYYILASNKNALADLGAGNTFKELSGSALKNFKIKIPKHPEQQKIADCLSSIDALITAQTQKIAALKNHKKGLMQQLFPLEGETVPKLRFSEFLDAGDWEADTLVNVANFRRGSFPQPYGLPEWYDEISGMPFVQVFDVSDNLLLKPKTKNKISQLAAEQSVFIPKETVIITIQGSIGRVAITQYDAYIDRTLLLFERFLKPLNKLFFAYVLQLLFEIEKQKAPGGIIKTITKEVLSDFEIKFPDINEQQKIADCLSSVDELITAQIKKINALKDHKKGLMQQLFPNADEVGE